MNNPFVICPYNKEHTMPRSRIQAHLVKCQEKYPELKICPYNATHRMTEAEINKHVEACPSRREVFNDFQPRVTGVLSKTKPLLQRMYLPVTDPEHEDWDD